MSKEIIVGISSRRNLNIKNVFMNNLKVSAFEVGMSAEGFVSFQTKPVGIIFKSPIEVEVEYQIQFEIHTGTGSVNLVSINYDGYRLNKRLAQAELSKLSLTNAITEKLSRDGSIRSSAEMFGLSVLPDEEMMEEIRFYNQQVYKQSLQSIQMIESVSFESTLQTYVENSIDNIGIKYRQISSKVFNKVSNDLITQQEDLDKEVYDKISKTKLFSYKFFKEEEMTNNINQIRNSVLKNKTLIESKVYSEVEKFKEQFDSRNI